jgi:hypothetical protein
MSILVIRWSSSNSEPWVVEDVNGDQRSAIEELAVQYDPHAQIIDDHPFSPADAIAALEGLMEGSTHDTATD